ncbi:TPA: hypothetical protein ACKP1C_000140 [Serratia marcescens]|uniref:hypothetical protein n=1 Tax=Serratia TaxID=613 RepID=UPI001E3142C8|nr:MULTISPECIES: hypothetical protein [Serratia]
MKRMPRNPGKFEALEAFTSFSRIHDFKLKSPEDTDKFLEMFGESFKASQENPTLLHGKHKEILFGHLASGLGKCRLVKTEDTGEVISDDSDIALPDYRLILNDGRQIFVEVKNCNQPNVKSLFNLQKSYVEKLQRYGELNGVPVYFAIYYRIMRIWTLLPISSFIEHKKKYSTNAIHSYANSELSMLGDLTIGTKPPLIFELVADQSRDVILNENDQASFIIGGVKIYSGDVEIEDPQEKTIAFNLMRFGRWDCGEAEGVMGENDKLHSVRYTFNPDSLESYEKSGFDIIGSLSSMITSAFNEQTIYENKIAAIDMKADIDAFSVKIPEDYKHKELPLWILDLRANPEFKGWE